MRFLKEMLYDENEQTISGTLANYMGPSRPEEKSAKCLE